MNIVPDKVEMAVVHCQVSDLSIDHGLVTSKGQYTLSRSNGSRRE